MRVEIFQIHKRNSYVFSEIQDKYCVDLRRNIFTLSDGATQGYKAELWAESLTRSFLEYPTFDIEKLMLLFTSAANEFSNIDFGKNNNAALRALEARKKELGSFATFLGVELKDNFVRYISSGDVCAFIQNDSYIQSFPFSNVEELDKDKGFLGTAKLLSGEVKEEQFKFGNLPLEKGQTLFLMTDALARLALKNEGVLSELKQLNNFEEFKNLILCKWEAKVLEEDDISVIIINPDEEDSLSEFLPPPDFSFPKEERPGYTGTATIPINTNDLSEEEMKEIQQEFRKLNDNINSIEHQNTTLRKDIKIFKLVTLLSLGISLIAFSTGAFALSNIYFSKSSSQQVSKTPISTNIDETQTKTLNDAVSRKKSIQKNVSVKEDSVQSEMKDTKALEK